MWPVDGLPFLRETEDVLMRQAGSTGVMDTGWGQAGHLMRWSRAGLRVLPHNVDVRPLHIRPHEFAAIARQYKDTGDKKFLVRNPSYADPEFLDKAKQKARDAATLLKPYHIPAYVLCDEPSLTSYRDEFDFDFHPKNIELFRAALEKKFGAVADLNTALGTAAANFEEIVPPTTAEARKSGNWSLWNEWRAHNDSVMADGYRMYRDAIREVDPQGRISISGTQVANPFDGFDWVKLSPLFDAMSGYGYGDQERTRMSFHPGAIKNATPAGYGAKGRTVPYQVWNALADHGCGHVLFWWVSFRNPDLTFCQSALDYQKMFNEMRNGIGRQYQLGARHKSPVAVLYSMNAMRAAWTRGQFGEWSSALAGVTSALVAQGLDPVYVSDEQIAGGDLERRGIKAVFLPMPVSLGRGGKKGSVDVAGGLLKFAGAGGLVVATHDPVCDEFLREAPVDPELLKKIRKFDDVKAQPGAVLAEVGVKPYVSVQRAEGGLVPGLSVAVHKLGGNLPAYIVTLTRKPVGQKEVIGGDGVVSYVPDASGGNEIEKCVIDVSALGKGTATVFRADKIQTTQNGTLNLDMPGGDGLPISVLPYALKGIDVSQKIEGRNLLITWQLQRSDGGKDFAPHALRISIRDEKNAEDPALSQNVTSNASGSGSIEIPLAQEDSGRKLDVQIKDVLTGTMAAAPLIVP